MPKEVVFRMRLLTAARRKDREGPPMFHAPLAKAFTLGYPFFIHSATPVPHMGCSQHLSLTSALPPIWTGSIQLRLTSFCVKIGYLNQTYLVYPSCLGALGEP